MKKTFLAGALLATAAISQAGTMGEEEINYKTTPFIVAEGNFSWLANKKQVINSVTSVQSNNRWGGRFGAGITREYKDDFSFSGEIGYGYYGRVRSTFPNAANNGFFAVDGLDILAGVLYKLKKIDAFFKAGALVSNMRIKETLDTTLSYSTNVVVDSASRNTNYTQVLPEIKTGAMYNYSKNVAFIVSYMHVFGSTPSTTILNSVNERNVLTILNSYSNIHSQNPYIDSVLFGIQVNIT